MNSDNVNPAAGNSRSQQPDVLLVHGMWSLPETLQELHDAFVAMGFVVESLCLPHHYEKSAYNDDRKARLASTRLEDYVDHIVERIRQKSRPPILVGHSMGALLAQLAAVRVPCERLILLSSAAPAGINGLGLSVIRTLGRNLLRFPLWKTVTEVSLAQVRYGIANAQNPILQQHIAEHCTYESGMATTQVSLGLLLGNRSSAHVDFFRIQCPVLIIGGTADRITPIRIQRQIARRFGGKARLIEIADCCHWTIGGAFFPKIQSAIHDWFAAMEQRTG